MEVQDTLDTLSKGLLIQQGILGGKKKVKKKNQQNGEVGNKYQREKNGHKVPVGTKTGLGPNPVGMGHH